MLTKFTLNGYIFYPVHVQKPHAQGKDTPSRPSIFATSSKGDQLGFMVCYGAHGPSMFSASHRMYAIGVAWTPSAFDCYLRCINIAASRLIEQSGTSMIGTDANEPLTFETNDFVVLQEDYPDEVSDSHQLSCD